MPLFKYPSITFAQDVFAQQDFHYRRVENQSKNPLFFRVLVWSPRQGKAQNCFDFPRQWGYRFPMGAVRKPLPPKEQVPRWLHKRILNVGKNESHYSHKLTLTPWVHPLHNLLIPLHKHQFFSPPDFPYPFSHLGNFYK